MAGASVGLKKQFCPEAAYPQKWAPVRAYWVLHLSRLEAFT